MSRKKIMIIDDDEYTIDLYKMMIEMISANGYISTELNPVKALDDLKRIYEAENNKFPDYILLDISMPEMNGFDFIDHFQKLFPDKSKSTDFIITTSSILEKDKEKANSLRCVKGFIIKPIPADYIARLIQGSARA
ncbi:MAG: response regulator [Bacteroidota bacterium]